MKLWTCKCNVFFLSLLSVCLLAFILFALLFSRLVFFACLSSLGWLGLVGRTPELAHGTLPRSRYFYSQKSKWYTPTFTAGQAAS